jgi:hypothetical protein
MKSAAIVLRIYTLLPSQLYGPQGGTEVRCLRFHFQQICLPEVPISNRPAFKLQRFLKFLNSPIVLLLKPLKLGAVGGPFHCELRR